MASSCPGPAWGSGSGALAQTTRALRATVLGVRVSRGLRQHAPCGSKCSVYPALRNSMDFREGLATASLEKVPKLNKGLKWVLGTRLWKVDRPSLRYNAGRSCVDR